MKKLCAIAGEFVLLQSDINIYYYMNIVLVLLKEINDMKKSFSIIIPIIFTIFTFSHNAYPHCDTMDGPVIKDAKLALEKKNVNYVLKWVRPVDENEVIKAFALAVKVRSLNADSKELSEKYFYENLVRIHRAGEGVPFTGVKPSGTPIDEKIKAADKAIETGNLKELEKLIPDDKRSKLNELFNKAMGLKKFDVNNVKAGREYIEAYVKYFHFAEGEEGHRHNGHEEHLKLLIPIILSIILFITTIILGGLYLKNKKTFNS